MEKKLLEINWNLLKVFSWFSNNLKCGEFSHLLCNLFRWTTCISKHFCLKLKHMETSFSPKKFGAITSTFCNVYAAWLFIFFLFYSMKKFPSNTHAREIETAKKSIYNFMTSSAIIACLMMIRRALIEGEREIGEWHLQHCMVGCRFT